MSTSAGKKDLVELVKSKTNDTTKNTEAAVNATLEAIKELVDRQGSIRLVGFGNFEKRHRAERKGKNPQTGKEITIAASTTVGFKPAKAFKEAVNK